MRLRELRAYNSNLRTSLSLIRPPDRNLSGQWLGCSLPVKTMRVRKVCLTLLKERLCLSQMPLFHKLKMTLKILKLGLREPMAQNSMLTI